jgi:hypothetical protein
VNHAVNTPLRGDFIATYEPIREGTKLTWRWEVRAENRVLNALVTALRPFLIRSLQANLNEYGKAAPQAHAGAA